MRKDILMMLLAVVSNSAMAKWVEIGGSNTKGITVYINKDNQYSFGVDIVAIHTLLDFTSPQKLDENTQNMSTDRLVHYDCKAKKYQVQNASFYANNMGEGKLVWLTPPGPPDPKKWEKVERGSLEMDMFEAACRTPIKVTGKGPISATETENACYHQIKISARNPNSNLPVIKLDYLPAINAEDVYGKMAQSGKITPVKITFQDGGETGYINAYLSKNPFGEYKCKVAD